MTIRRHALLIGVGETPKAAGRFDALTEVVTKDLEALATQLAASGYEVSRLDPAEGPVDKGDITTALETAATRDCDLLLIHFTGHGVRLDGRDYLVPGDALAPAPGTAWTAGQRGSLLELDITGFLRGCRAPSVVLTVDACRDAQDSGDGDAFGAATLHAPSERLALFVGCGRGQRCHYGPDGSHFSQALAEALDPLTPERTLEAVVHKAKARTEELARRHDDREQRPVLSVAPADEALSSFPEPCAGTDVPLRWREAVRKAGIWAAREDEPGPDAAMRRRISEFAHRCAVSVLRDRRRFDDPWQDPGLPERVLRRVLPVLLRGSPERSPVETGLLAGLPLLREAMWARKLSRLAEADPFDLDAVADPERPPTGMRTELRYVHESHPQLLRKARGHLRRGEEAEYHALAAWLAHRWVAEQLAEKPDPGCLELARDLARALLGPDKEHRVDDIATVLVGAVRFLADEPVNLDVHDLYLRNAPAALPTTDGLLPVHWWSVLGAVRLAGLLAADPRLFPDVLAEHVGVTDPVVPAAVVETLQQSLEWAREGDGLHLNMACPHPALYESLLDVTRRADGVLRAVTAERRLGQGDLMAALPARITSRELLAARPPDSEDRAFSVPLLRFTLAQDEIRELLMGHQLYGDRALAVRELYQNAADACRYRAMRWDYLKRFKDFPIAWSGEIRITQGRETGPDGRPGRAYIECRDNGVGMSRALLEQTFSRAGRRFSQTRPFRREQAEWLIRDKSLQLYPYSRFGIGVLSYFMISDEVSLVTREVGPDGAIAPQALAVDISSSSGLFNIRPYERPDDPLHEGGTRVRLMLSEPEEGQEPVSVTDVLEQQVRLSEHRLLLREEGREHVERKAGRLYHRDGGPKERMARPREAGGSVWWVRGDGMLLADGIVSSRTPFGYVVNLSGAQAPKLSVDRNSLLEWNEEWTEERLLEAAEALPGWDGLDLDWLWRLENSDGALAAGIAERLAGRGLTLPVYRVDTYARPDVNLDEVGWFPDDRRLLPSGPGEIGGSRRWFAEPWRRAVLCDQGVMSGAKEDGCALPRDVSGHPVPGPGDNALLDNATAGTSDLVHHAAQTGRTVAGLLRRARRFALLGTGLRIPAVAAAATPELDFVPDDLDLPLVSWMTDWSEPARARRQPAVGGLISISAYTGMSLGMLLDRCRRYAPLGLTPPPVPAHCLEHRASARDAELLSGWAENRRHYSNDGLPREVLPVHVARLAEQLGTSGADVLAALREREHFGYLLPSEEDLLPAAPTDTQWDLFRSFVAEAGGEGDRSLQSVLALAARHEIPVDEVLRSVDGLAGPRTTPWLPEVPAGLPALARADLKLLTTDNGSGEVLPYRSVPLDLLALCYAPGGKFPGHGSDLDFEPWDAFAARVRRLERFGMKVPGDLEPLRRWIDLSPRDRMALLIGSLDPTVPWTAATLVCTAGELGESLGESRDRLAAHASWVGKEAPRLPDEAMAFKPSEADSELLTEVHDLDVGTCVRADWATITPLALARYADGAALSIPQALERLAPYRLLGAPVPELTAEQAERARDVKPDQFDVLALSEDMDGKNPPKFVFSALDLVAVAARGGRPVREVYERLRCYEPFGVVVEADGAPDVLPLWQDMVLLSEGLNGRAPALSGSPTPELIAGLARELDTDEAWVGERLRTYAPLFGLYGEPGTSPEAPDPTAAAPATAAGAPDATAEQEPVA
ncbi:HD domain-containing protein [Streptomyces sp. NPDC003688]